MSSDEDVEFFEMQCHMVDLSSEVQMLQTKNKQVQAQLRSSDAKVDEFESKLSEMLKKY